MVRVLIAEDDPVGRRLLSGLLQDWGYEVVEVVDGEQAWPVLTGPEPPPLVILDWMLPGVEGPELCRRLAELHDGAVRYVILLTIKTHKDDIVAGLDAGADDFVAKPFYPAELRARVRAGERIIRLRYELAARIDELETALSQVKELRGLLPICSYCKRVRDDKAYWREIEVYISSHTDAQFSHGICPECYKKFVEPELEALSRRSKRQARGSSA